MKASSQAAGWKGMLIKHGEKAVLGLIGVFVVWMMFTGLQQEGLKPDKVPTKLADRVDNAEQYIAASTRLKPENGGEKFQPQPYDMTLTTGLKELKFDDKPYNIEPEEFPKIAKRSQPVVYPAEEVHVTALVVQVALNDEAAVEKQLSFIQDLNNKKAIAEARKLAAEERKQQEKEQRERLRQANQQNNRGGARENQRPSPLLDPQHDLAMEQPFNPQDIRQPHPAIQNLTGVTSATRGIAVVTALIPYRKQIAEFRQTLVDGKDIIPGRLPEDDSPKIATFIVERARVVNPNEPLDKLEWVDITEDSQKFFTQYGKQLTKSEDPVVPSLMGPYTEGIPKKNIARWMTVSPLPTLADRKWQREVTHPRIPLYTDLNEAEINQEQTNEFLPVAPEARFGQPILPLEQVEVELPEYVLLRHIDFNVVPGLNYRYRVTLQYKNPNLGLDNKYLGNEASPAEELVTTPSAPSDIVTLPPLHQILAGGELNYPPPRRLDAVPSSRVWQWLIDIDPKLGGQVAKDFSGISVGELLEFTDTVKNVLNRPTGQPYDLENYVFSEHKVPRGTQTPYLVDVFGKQAPPPPRPPRPVPGIDGLIPQPVPEPPRPQPYSEILYVDEEGKLRSSSSTYADTLIDNYKLRYESTEGTGNMPGEMHDVPRGGGGRNPLFDRE